MSGRMARMACEEIEGEGEGEGARDAVLEIVSL